MLSEIECRDVFRETCDNIITIIYTAETTGIPISQNELFMFGMRYVSPEEIGVALEHLLKTDVIYGSHEIYSGMYRYCYRLHGDASLPANILYPFPVAS